MKERIIKWIVWHLPKIIIYWATIRLICHGTSGKYSMQIVPELLAMNALERWDKDNDCM